MGEIVQGWGLARCEHCRRRGKGLETRGQCRIELIIGLRLVREESEVSRYGLGECCEMEGLKVRVVIKTRFRKGKGTGRVE